MTDTCARSASPCVRGDQSWPVGSPTSPKLLKTLASDLWQLKLRTARSPEGLRLGRLADIRRRGADHDDRAVSVVGAVVADRPEHHSPHPAVSAATYDEQISVLARLDQDI